MDIMKILAEDPETGFQTQLYELPAGFVSNKHRHTDFEWVYIAKGVLQDEFGSYPSGTLKINPKGSIHKSYSEKGCTLIVFTRAKHEPLE